MEFEGLRNFGIIFLGIMGVCLVLGLILVAVVLRQVKHIEVPPGAGFGETLLYTPFIVVLMIDLLDMGLDFFSAPISWVILDRIGLKGLRNVSAIEALIPATQIIPTMTLCWIGARVFGVSEKSIPG